MSVRRSCVPLVFGAFALSIVGCGEPQEREPARAPLLAAPQTVVVAYPANVTLAPAPAAKVAPPPPPPVLADGTYVLRNVASHECLDLPNRSLASPTLLWQWDCNGTDAQSWTLHKVDGDTYEVRSLVSGKCLDVPHQDKGNNITLWQYDCNHTDAQRWTFTLAPDGSYTLRAVASGLCLDVPHGTATRGLGVQQYTCHGGTPQRWQVTKAS